MHRIDMVMFVCVSRPRLYAESGRSVLCIYVCVVSCVWHMPRYVYVCVCM